MTGKLLLSNIEANVPVFVVVALAVFIYLRSRRAVLWREAYRRLGKNKLALGALVIIGLYSGLVGLDCLSWQASANDESKTVIDMIFQKPFERTYSAPLATTTSGEVTDQPLVAKHLLGTDSVGEDVVYKVIKGMRTSFIIGGFSCLVAVPIALAFGLIAGYFGKWVDDIVQFLYTVFGSVPDILLIIAIVMMLGKNISSVCLALGFTSWIGLCRLVRGETLKHRDREYVRAAKALGVSDLRILSKHILPNLLPSVIIAVTLLFSTLALYETILSYLGVGMPPGAGSWGNMIDAARDELTRNPIVWWNLVFATSALLLLVLSLNVLADALRDAIDPRLRTQ
jgi:peptide/nickel transport system permease protein